MSSGLRTTDAAALLGVSPNTLRSWERRFGYPLPVRSPGGHRQFDRVEIETLRQAFEETHNISSAISIARERGQTLASPARLRGALSALDGARCDQVLAESLAVASVERTVENLLLPELAALHEATATRSLEYAFAWRHAHGWLAAARRTSGSLTHPDGILLLDGSRPCELDALHVDALELFLRRAGLPVAVLGLADAGASVVSALRALAPRAVVQCGRDATLETLGRLVYAGGRGTAVFDFRGALERSTAVAVRLERSPLEAANSLRASVDLPLGGAASRPPMGAAAGRRAQTT